MTPHGPWKIISSQTVYRDPWLSLTRDEVVRPDGLPGSHSVVHIKPGVSVLALDAEGMVYLTEEFHYAVGRVTIECVSGGIDEGEEPLEAARRELQEEVGLEAADWRHLGTVDPFTSSLASPTQIYLARTLTPVEAAPEGTELIRRVKLPFAEALQMVFDNQITHAPSCVVILKAAAVLGHRLSL